MNKIEVIVADPATVDSGALVVGITEGAAPDAGLDKALDGALSALVESGDLRGKAEQVRVYYPRDEVAAQRIVLVGLGKADEVTLEQVRRSVAAAARRCRTLNAADLAVATTTFPVPESTTADIAQAITEGILLGLYRFTEFKEIPADEATEVTDARLVTGSENEASTAEGARLGQIFARATMWARDLGNRPGNSVTPRVLAEAAQSMATDFGLQCRVLEEADMKELGMGALLGVAQGSDEPAKFIILEYTPSQSDAETVVLVGKGITFDSGGISIKPSQNMGDMKFDMCGAAAVLATMRALPHLKPPVRVIGLVPATENLPGGRAYKPGDIVKAMNGTTIEVVNTDAEGRLILADALAYAARYEPKAVIDLATLTGGCVVALGDEASGLFGNDDQLIERVRRAGEESGDRTWPLPLWPPYKKKIESKVADIKNSAGRWASAITAAAFLSRFTESYSWTHLDIAGTAYTSNDQNGSNPYAAQGATGVGVRLLLRFLREGESKAS
ncbi:MAG: leucyl aminopeptidase [Chloroflexi bacterium]|nr:leucyl aminopeptidase [Chloroflexota bacterium]